MSELADYAHRYRSIAFERTGSGILELRLHRDGGPFVFDERTHHEFGQAFRDVAADPRNRVVILTGTGDRFCADFDSASFHRLRVADPARFWQRVRQDGMTMLTEFLNIPVPVIAAVNGPAFSHSELPLLADVVLGADDVRFRDGTHFVNGIPPGDGMHIVWKQLLGPNEGRAFLMLGKIIEAEEALRRGIVAELHPREDLLARAYRIAGEWARKSDRTLQNTRAMVNQSWRVLFATELHTGLTYEALADEGLEQAAPTIEIVDLLAASSRREAKPA